MSYYFQCLLTMDSWQLAFGFFLGVVARHNAARLSNLALDLYDRYDMYMHPKLSTTASDKISKLVNLTTGQIFTTVGKGLKDSKDYYIESGLTQQQLDEVFDSQLEVEISHHSAFSAKQNEYLNQVIVSYYDIDGVDLVECLNHAIDVHSTIYSSCWQIASVPFSFKVTIADQVDHVDLKLIEGKLALSNKSAML